MLSTAEIIYTICYTLLFTTLIIRLRFFRNFSLSVKWIAGIFLFKVLAGTAYGLIHYYLYEGGDTFAYFYDGLIIRKSLSSDPIVFLKLVFGINSRPPDPDILRYAQALSYWNDMGSYFIIRFHALASLFTFGHYYANSVIYNFFTLIGSLYLFEFICRFLPEKKFLIITALFFFPSVTFWSSGIHKDGISIAAIGLILYFASSVAGRNFPERMVDNKSLRDLVWLMVGVWLLFIVRNYLLMLLGPCLLSFIWILKFPKRSLIKFLFVHIIFYGILFNLHLFNPQLDLFGKMVQQQKEFSSLYSGNTNVILPSLDSNSFNLVALIPQALFNCLIQPLIWNISNPIQLSSAVDNILIWLLIILTLFYFKKDGAKENALFLFSIFFTLSVFIFVGMIVPNIGALVRYKMPGVLFLVMGCLSLLDTQRRKFNTTSDPPRAE